LWGQRAWANIDYRYRNTAANDFSTRPDTVAVCGATNATPIVIQTCAPHTFLAWQAIRIQGVAGNTAANGLHIVKAVADSTHFSLYDPWSNDVPGNGTYTSGGTVVNALYQGSNDARDIGVDQQNIPLIRSLSVTPMAYAALFRWVMPSGMYDATCQLEVSSDAGLSTDAADYTLVNALRADYFIRAESDAVNTRATLTPDRVRRWFQVGDNSSATGDDAQSHSLALTPSTVYYYRLMCGGAMERGTFTTKASDTSVTSIAVATKATVSGATKVRARYGTLAGTLTTGDATACASGCTLTIPATSGKQLVLYIDQLSAADAVLYAPAVPMVWAIGS
jgi:hypothetical protein